MTIQRYPTALSAIIRFNDEGTSKLLSSAMDAINTVHRVSLMPPVPVMMALPEEVDGRGVYEFLPEGFSLSGRPVPVRIRVVLETPFPQSAFTFVHEVGHLLDQQSWQGIGWASYGAEEMKPLMTALNATRAVQELLRLATLETISISEASNMIFTVPQRRIKILLQNQELWARAYAQYIAVRSGDTILLSELEQERSQTGLFYLPSQWENDDFRSIKQAITALFEGKGWL